MGESWRHLLVRAAIGSGADYQRVCTEWTLDELADVLIGLDVRDITRADMLEQVVGAFSSGGS